MKKNGIVAVIALLAVAYPATAWLIGKNIESSLTEYRTKALADVPYVKIVKSDYQRGLFSATEKVSVEIAGDLLRSLEGMKKSGERPENGEENPDAAPEIKPASPAETAKPLIITFVNRIAHGPLAGGKLALGKIETTLEFDEKVTQEIVKVFGNNKPLEIVTTMSWNGAGTSTVNSPATVAPFKRGTAEMSWQGLQGTVDFTKGTATYRATISAPGISIKDSAKNEEINIVGMQVVSDKRRLKENSGLYLGRDTGTIKSFSVNGQAEGSKTFTLQDISYTSDMNESAGFADMIAKMGAAKLIVASDSYGPVHYDFSVKHLKSDVLEQFFKSFAEIYSGKHKTAEEFSAATLAPWKKFGPELLKYNPEFIIDRISFAMPEGEAKLNANVKIPGTTPEDMANPFMLIGKLDASADIALPEALVAKLSGSGNKTAEEQAAAKAMFEQQIAGLEQQGYVIRENKILKSRLKFKDGKATINDKPFQMPGSAPS